MVSRIRALVPATVERPKLRINGMLRSYGRWEPLTDKHPIRASVGDIVVQTLRERAAVDYRLPAGNWKFLPAPPLDGVAWKAHEHYMTQHGNRPASQMIPVWYGTMRVKDLMYGVMNDIARTQGYRNFDHYHEWYLENVLSKDAGRGMPPDSDEVWPVILSTFADEGLQDGSHRFHQYVELGLDKIPVLAYATELQEIRKLAKEWFNANRVV